jgi:hypothetical protein
MDWLRVGLRCRWGKTRIDHIRAGQLHPAYGETSDDDVVHERVCMKLTRT